MFVYLLLDAHAPRFKIGKANDIHLRIASLGGASAFDLEASRCIRLSSPKDALRIEKILHRLFARSNIPPTPGARHAGDTEMFEIDCLERVKQFLSDNPDLIDGAIPGPLPAAKVRPAPVVVEPASRRVRRARDAIGNAERLDAAIPQILAALTAVRSTPGAEVEVFRSPYDTRLSVRCTGKAGHDSIGELMTGLVSISIPPAIDEIGATCLVSSVHSWWSNGCGYVTGCIDEDVAFGSKPEFAQIRDQLRDLSVKLVSTPLSLTNAHDWLPEQWSLRDRGELQPAGGPIEPLARVVMDVPALSRLRRAAPAP